MSRPKAQIGKAPTVQRKRNVRFEANMTFIAAPYMVLLKVYRANLHDPNVRHNITPLRVRIWPDLAILRSMHPDNNTRIGHLSNNIDRTSLFHKN
jgi:hypothetical protein